MNDCCVEIASEKFCAAIVETIGCGLCEQRGGTPTLGEKATLRLLQPVCWWIGIAESVRWWYKVVFIQPRKITRNLSK